MKTLPLSRGRVALVDDTDFEWLNQWKWTYGHGYAYRGIGLHGTQKRIYLHRLIVNPAKGEVVDHINGNKLDNRRKNLRICTHAQNISNHKLSSNNTSGYIGVSRIGKRWRAYGGKRDAVKHLGVFDSPEQAARARDSYVMSVFGEYARLNFAKEQA